MKDMLTKLTAFAAIFGLVMLAGCGGATRPSASSFDDPQAEGEAWEESEFEEAEVGGDSAWEDEAMEEGALASMGESPESGASFSVSAEGGDSYTVVPGDNLWDISAKESIYSDPWEWPIIYHANEGQISDPNLIKKDWILGIPRDFDTAIIQAAKEEAMAAVYTPPGSRDEAGKEFDMDETLASVDEAAGETDVAAVAPVDEKKGKKDKKGRKGRQKKGGGAGTAMTIVTIVALALAIGAGVVYYRKKQKEKASLGVNQVEQPSA